MKSNQWRRFLLAILLIAIFPAASTAEEASTGIDPSLVIEQFEIFKDGDVLVVPVKVFGKDRLFAVDTGASTLVYDESMRLNLGAPQETVKANTLTAKKTVELFAAPPATLGSLDMQTETPVACIDFSELRAETGHDIEGLIGMAFLHQFIVHLDFEAGKLSFLHEVPSDAGERKHFVWKAGTPRIRCQVQDGDAQYFTIDTGFIGEVCIGSTLFETLSKQGLVTKAGSNSVTGASGRVKVEDGYLAGLSLGSMKMAQVPVMQLPTDHSHLLGSKIWSRFTVTFDFPNMVVYLKPNRDFHRPFEDDIDGMTFIRRDGLTVVRSLGSSGASAKAGIQRDDRLLEIDELDATTTRLFTLRQKLSVPGATVPVKLERGEEVFDVKLRLPEKEEAEREVVELQEPEVPPH